MKVEVDPFDLRFTQDSIAVRFEYPFNDTRIDDAVNKIVRREWTASRFACIRVVKVDGYLFSLDNRRLWVFRKALLNSITVELEDDYDHPGLQALMDNPSQLKMMKSESFFPRVRGKVRQTTWSIPDAHNDEESIFISLAKAAVQTLLTYFKSKFP